MNKALTALAATAGTTLITLTVTAVWQRARAGAAELARRVRRNPTAGADPAPGPVSLPADDGPTAEPHGEFRVHSAARDGHHAFGDPFPNPSGGEGGLWQESVRTPLVESPPRVFRGRGEILAGLTAALHDGGVHVLHGMGGSGKTCLAAEVFDATRAEGTTALWVVGSDRTALRRGMLAVAADLGADLAEVQAAHEGRIAAADLAWRRLDRSRPWLLVIDKADDPGLLEGWLHPEGLLHPGRAGGTVLVTTRRARASQWQHAVLHHLDTLPPPDAAQVLLDFAPDRGSFQDAIDLADRLECLPLALRLAGGYLEGQALETWSLTDYLRHFDREGALLADQGAEPPSTDRAIMPDSEREQRQRLSGTWQISLNALDAQGLPEATTLLRLLSCWSPALLPRTVLADAPPGAATTPELADLLHGRAETALRALIDNSLVTAHTSASPGSTTIACVQAHSLVLETIHTGIGAQDRAGYLRTAIRMAAAALPDGSAPADAGQLHLLAPHITALLHHTGTATCEEAVRLGIRMAQRICEAGDYRAAADLATLAGDISDRLQGPGHHDTMTARHHQGDYLRRLGAYQEAEQVLHQVYDRRAAALGARDRDTLETAAALSMTLYLLGRHKECLSWIRKAIDGQRRTLGRDHVETLKSRAFALEFLAHAGLTEQFLRDGPATIADAERVLGTDDGVTAIAYSNYAYGMLHAGTPQDARAAAERALAARTRLYGDDHPLVHSAKLVLSWAHSRCGDHRTALTLMTQALQGRERLLGPTHPLTVKARVLYAERLAEAGRPGHAAQILRDNLDQAERLYGAHDPDIQRATALRDQLRTPQGPASSAGGGVEPGPSG